MTFDRSSFKLFTLRFSNKSVQAPYCERSRTAPRTLFLSFANYNYFQIAVFRRSCMKKSVKLACHVVNSNIAMVLCRRFKYRQELQRYLKRFLMESRFLPSFQISGRMYNAVVSIKMYDVKRVSQPDTIALLGNNYRLQMIETGFAEQFQASYRMGPAPICLKISARIA